MRMRKVLPVLLGVAALVAVARPAAAQAQYNDEGIGFGVLGGITSSTISNDTEIDFDSATGWMAGIWFGGNRNGTLGFMGEISYVVKGATGAISDSELKIHYLEIPALVRINLGQTKNQGGVLFYPMVGPVVDIQLKNELNGVDVSDQFNGFDIGIIFGGGVEVARFAFEVRYNMGLKGIVSDGDGGFGDFGDSKNRSWQFLGKFRIN